MTLNYIFSLLLATSMSYGQAPDYSKVATSFLSAKEKAWQLEAKASDIDKIFVYCSDSIQYDHVLSPTKTFSFKGTTDWRRGMISHLGETRNVKLKIVKMISRQNVVIVEYNLSREVKDGDAWKPSTITTVSMMEFDEGGKIKKIVDYL